MRAQPCFLVLTAVAVAGLLARSSDGTSGSLVDGGVDAAPLPDAAPPPDAGVDAAEDATGPDSNATQDSGVDSDSDAGADSGSDATDAPDASDASDAAQGDAGPTPQGRLLVPGTGLTLLGITSDKAVIYQAQGVGSVGPIYAVPLAGGTPRVILEGDLSSTLVVGPAVYTLGRAAAVGSCPLPPGGLSSLVVWTAARGTVTLSSSVEGPIGATGVQVAAYGGGTKFRPAPRIAFEAQSETTCGREVLVANLSDLTVARVAPSPACAPPDVDVAQLQLAPNGDLLTNLCASDATAPDAGAAMQSSFFRAGTTSPTVSLPGTMGAELDPRGAWIWARLAAGGAELVKTLDGSVAARYPDALTPAWFDASGSHAYYTTAARALVQVTLAAATSTVLESSGASVLLAIDPTGQSLLYINDAPTPSVYLRPTSPGGTPTHVSDFGQAFDWGFTADGRYLLMRDEKGGVPTGAVTAIATGNPSSVVKLATSWFAPLRGAQVLGTSPDGAGVVVDASGSAPSWTFAPSVNGALATANGASIVYATTASPAGLYAVATP